MILVGVPKRNCSYHDRGTPRVFVRAADKGLAGAFLCKRDRERTYTEAVERDRWVSRSGQVYEG